MTLNELDVQIDIEITAEQMRTYEEIIISTPQGRIAYTLTPQTQLNKIYRFKGKGHRRIGYNIADEVGDFYVKFTSTKISNTKEVPPTNHSLYLNLYNYYYPIGKTGDTHAIPSFISMFSECLEHPSTGYYGKDVYIVLEALDDILVITLQYTFHATTYDVEKTYCYKFFMGFTPDNQLHYACSSSFPDKFNQGERTIILEDDIAHFLNCMSIAMWNQEMRDKGYYASFDIEHDASIITLNEKHCTITQYLAEAFHVSAEPVSNTFLKERLMPNYIKQSALEMTEKRKREQYEADMRMQSFFDRFN